MRLLLVAIALVVVGCGATVTASGSVGPAGSPASSSNATLPSSLPSSATPDPEAVRKAAAAAYAAAAAKYNKDLNALAKKCKTFESLKMARNCYASAAKINGAYVTALKGIQVPADTASDLHALVAKVTAVQAVLIEGSKARSWAAFDSAGTPYVKADRAASAAANLVRSDLGLPPVGS